MQRHYKIDRLDRDRNRKPLPISPMDPPISQLIYTSQSCSSTFPPEQSFCFMSIPAFSCSKPVTTLSRSSAQTLCSYLRSTARSLVCTQPSMHPCLSPMWHDLAGPHNSFCDPDSGVRRHGTGKASSASAHSCFTGQWCSPSLD